MTLERQLSGTWFRLWANLELCSENLHVSCDHELPTFTDGNTLAFAVMGQILAPLSLHVLIYCATERAIHKYARTRLMNVSMEDVA